MSGGDEGGAGKRAGCAAEISAIGHVAFSLFTVGRSVNACCPEGCSEVDGGDVLHGLGVRLQPLEHQFVGARARVAGAAAALGQLAGPFVGGVGGGFGRAVAGGAGVGVTHLGLLPESVEILSEPGGGGTQPSALAACQACPERTFRRPKASRRRPRRRRRTGCEGRHRANHSPRVRSAQSSPPLRFCNGFASVWNESEVVSIPRVAGVRRRAGGEVGLREREKEGRDGEMRKKRGRRSAATPSRNPRGLCRTAWDRKSMCG